MVVRRGGENGRGEGDVRGGGGCGTLQELGRRAIFHRIEVS